MVPPVPMTAATTFAVGLRHGVDWDHLTAITDITGTEPSRRRGTLLALVYSGGHGAMVLVLGLLAVAAGTRLPPWIDPVMERLVGATLVLLAVPLLRSLAMGRARSRGMVLFDFLSKVRERFAPDRVVELEHEHAHEHDAMHRHESPLAVDGHAAAVRVVHRHAHRHEVRLRRYGVPGTLAIGALHGFGAETGTQVVVLVSAGRAGTTGAALTVVGTFVLGVCITTAATAVTASLGWAGVGRHTRTVRMLTLVAALASAAVGIVFLAGRSDMLPPLLVAPR